MPDAELPKTPKPAAPKVGDFLAAVERWIEEGKKNPTVAQWVPELGLFSRQAPDGGMEFWDVQTGSWRPYSGVLGAESGPRTRVVRRVGE